MSNEIKESKRNSPAEMILEAVQNNADLDKIERLLEIQMKWEVNEAKKEFNESMANVHSKIKSVVKDKKNTQTHSNYADLDRVINETKDVYTAEGFSVSFYEGENAPENSVRICADVTHRKGHSITRHYDVPLDGVGIKGNANMTAIHGKASSTSYGRRYLMCMIFNIPTSDDNDGNNKQKPMNAIAEINALAQAKFKNDIKSYNQWKIDNKFPGKASEATPQQQSKMIDLLQGMKDA